jgi:hypothetical protein
MPICCFTYLCYASGGFFSFVIFCKVQLWKYSFLDSDPLSVVAVGFTAISSFPRHVPAVSMYNIYLSATYSVMLQLHLPALSSKYMILFQISYIDYSTNLHSFTLATTSTAMSRGMLNFQRLIREQTVPKQHGTEPCQV